MRAHAGPFGAVARMCCVTLGIEVAGLRRLDLAGNRLTAVAGLPAGGALEELCLDRNAIKALDALSFAGVP